MRVSTFDMLEGGQVQGVLVADPSATGLCKVLLDDWRTVTRHVDKLNPLDPEAREVICRARKEETK